MTTPKALALADKCEESAASWLREIDTRKQAAALLRTQHADIERKDALLRRILDDVIHDDTPLYDLITKELSK